MIKTPAIPFIAIVTLLLLLSSCRSEFERIRMSGEPERILNAGMEYYDKGEYDRARTLFELVLNTYRGRSQAEELFFRYAYTHYHMEQYILSAFYFENFASSFPTSAKRQEANFMAAYSNYLLSPSFRLDQEFTHKAIESFQRYVTRYPNSDRIPEINDLMDEMRRKLERKAYYQADLYYNMGHYQAAIKSFEHLLQDYPETQDIEKVRYMIVKSSFYWAENSILARQPERYQQTITAYNNFVRRHADSPYRAELSNFNQISREQVNALTNE